MQENKKKLLDLFFSEECNSVVQTHLCSAEQLISAKNYHIFLEYAYAKAFLERTETLPFWKDIYSRVQKKYNLNNSIENFDALIKSMQKNGFDKMHPIPVDLDYNLIDGSHRLSISLALGLIPYIYVRNKIISGFPKENFTFLPEIAIRQLEEIEKYLSNKKLRKISKTNVFYFTQCDLNLWDQIVLNEKLSHNSIYFIKHLGYNLLDDRVGLTPYQKRIFKGQVGILMTPHTKAEIKRYLGAMPCPHKTKVLSKHINLKKILHL